MQGLHQMLPRKNWLADNDTHIERHSHMEKTWMRALNKKIQKKALVQKRSATCTVMQSKFTGVFLNQGGVLEK